MSLTAPERLPARLLLALDKPRVRGELLHASKPRHIVNLIEDRHRQNLANAGNRSEAVEGIRVVALGVPHEGYFEVVDEPIVLVDEHEVDVDALAHTRIGKLLGD